MRMPLARCLGGSLAAIAVALLSATAAFADPYDSVKADIDAGRSEAAVDSLHAMVKKEPDDYQAWFLLGVVNERQHRFHQAIEAFRKVIELRPELAEPHNNLAVIYNELGDVDAAVKELETSLKKKPGYAIAEENIADLYVKLALEHYHNALAKAPTPSLQQRYTKLLQVRDPAATADASAAQEAVQAAAETAAVTPAEQGPSPVEARQAALAAEQPAVVEPGVTETAVLPAKLPVIDAQQEKAQPAAEGSGDGASLPEPVVQDILQAVERWRAAWAARDVEGYFAAYAPDFETGDRFATLAQWKQYKRHVITSKAWISIELSDQKVEIDSSSGHAVVKFFQKFRSDSYNGDDRKLLEMKFDGSDWKIVREVSAS